MIPVPSTDTAAPEPARAPHTEMRRLRDLLERHGRTGVVSIESGRAFAEQNPQIAAELGITVDELAQLSTKSVTLEEALDLGLFEPIEDDPLAPFRTT
jgi:hypothetical protein